MISDAIQSIFSGVTGLFLGLLPVGTLLGSLTLSAGWLWGYDTLNSFLPIAEVLAAVTALLAMRMTMISLKLVTFVYKLLPFV